MSLMKLDNFTTEFLVDFYIYTLNTAAPTSQTKQGVVYSSSPSTENSKRWSKMADCLLNSLKGSIQDLQRKQGVKRHNFLDAIVYWHLDLKNLIELWKQHCDTSKDERRALESQLQQLESLLDISNYIIQRREQRQHQHQQMFQSDDVVFLEDTHTV